MALGTNKIEFDKGKKSFSVPNGQSRLKIHTAHLLRLTLPLPECLMEFCNVTLTFETADKILWCDHSNESFLPVLSHGAICFFKISQNKIWKFGRNLLLAKLGSERVKTPTKCTNLKWQVSKNPTLCESIRTLRKTTENSFYFPTIWTI